MAEIELANLSHRAELIELWAEAFGDGEGFVSSFLDAYMIPEYSVPAVISEGRLVSALYLIEFPLWSYSKLVGDCAYIYAAATKKDFRNRGYMSDLIKYSAELCKNRGLKAIFLFPQERTLFDFYARFGFRAIYAAKNIKSAAGLAVGHLQALVDTDMSDPRTFDDLYASYAEFTAKQALSPLKDRFFYFKCAKSYIEDGANFAIFEKYCYVFYKKDKNIYYIDDIILSGGQNIDETIKILGDHIVGMGYGFEMYVPASSRFCGENVPLAALLPLSADIADIVDHLKIPVYLNMFMNY